MFQFVVSYFRNGLSTIRKSFCRPRTVQKEDSLELLYREVNKIGGTVRVSLRMSGPQETGTEKGQTLAVEPPCSLTQCQQ